MSVLNNPMLNLYSPWEQLENIPLITEDVDDKLLEEFDPVKLFDVNYEEAEIEIMTEASDAKKGNVLNKLMNIIKKAIKFIGKCIMKVVNGVKKLFGGGKNKKTANQIAEAAGIPASNRDIKIPNAPDLTDDQKEYAKEMSKSMMASMIAECDDLSMTLLVPGELVAMDPDDQSIQVKGKSINAAWARAVQVIRLIQDPKPIDTYLDFFRRVTTGSTKEVGNRELERVYLLCQDFCGRSTAAEYVNDYKAKAIPKIINKIRNNVGPITADKEIPGGAVEGVYSKVRISMQSMIDLQKKVDLMGELCEEYDLYMKDLNLTDNFKGSNKAEFVNKTYMDILNEMAWACVELQGGLHAIANGLTGLWECGMQYWDTVDNPKLLAAFVEEAITTGMPGKYVVRNIYRICKENVKGNPKLDNPIMGFGRLTLIPEGDIIYKVAINRYGIRSNKNDFIVLDAVRKINDPKLSNMFADTVTKYGNYSVNVVEKVKAGSDYEPSTLKCSQLAGFINGRFRKAKVKLEIMDIKPDAFGQRDGHYVILDYGYIHRLTIRGQGDIKTNDRKKVAPDPNILNDVTEEPLPENEPAAANM